MDREVIVGGGGVGGLAAAARLARRGCRVRLLEAGPEVGGLASGCEHEGFAFDAGPYVLLDRPGLEWVFDELGMTLEEQVPLARLHQVYQVETPDAPTVRFHASLEQTAEEMDRQWSGSGSRYRAFVREMAAIYRRLQPLQRISRPGPGHLLLTGAWRDAPFLLRSLAAVLDGTGLPAPVKDAVGIWTQVAGQDPRQAPSPLAFVPSLIHGSGAWIPPSGVRAIPAALAAAARRAGAELRHGVRVRAIRCRQRRVEGVETDVETDDGAFLSAAAVVASSHGVGTCLTLLRETPARARRRLESLPLQSPGICAYLAVRGPVSPPYLRFRLPGDGGLCQLLVTPSAVVGGETGDGWSGARLIAPMDHRAAQDGGERAQAEYLDRVLAEPWWQEHVADFRVLAARTPVEWGRRFQLYRDSMNPVMTARFMREGRLAHRNPYVRGLYLAGSSTHPGQWVSFCAISGILAADRLLEDLRP